MKPALKAWLVAALASTALPAAAQLQFGRMDTGLYLGGSVGDGHFRHGCAGAPSSCDNDDVAGRVFAGWQFNRMLGVEAGFAYLGKVEADVPAAANVSLRTRSLDLVGVVSYPIHDAFAIYGKAGVARNRVTASVGFPGATFSGHDTGTNLTYAVGLRYNFARNFAARAEWQRYHVDPNKFVGSEKIDYFSLGLLYGWY